MWRIQARHLCCRKADLLITSLKLCTCCRRQSGTCEFSSSQSELAWLLLHVVIPQGDRPFGGFSTVTGQHEQAYVHVGVQAGGQQSKHTASKSRLEQTAYRPGIRAAPRQFVSASDKQKQKLQQAQQLAQRRQILGIPKEHACTNATAAAGAAACVEQARSWASSCSRPQQPPAAGGGQRRRGAKALQAPSATWEKDSASMVSEIHPSNLHKTAVGLKLPKRAKPGPNQLLSPVLDQVELPRLPDSVLLGPSL